ncbi:MAG: ribosomal subunit interface protein [Actinomycetota bacterium]|nr:ribosomal subunit interface protein [Actinomycetota bacterium]
MHVAVHTDNHISGTESLIARVASEVETVLAPHDARLTLVEVHLADESAGRETPHDMRCVVEAVLAGQPVAVATEHAETLDEAVSGAAHKLVNVLESRFGRLSGQTARRHA